MRKYLYFVGDIHGQFKTLIFNLTERFKIKDANIIVVGDFGVGFDHELEKDYNRKEHKLISNNLHIYSIRGNHDDPSFFIPDSPLNRPHLTLLPDHEVIELSGKRILPIGGAISTDKEYRLGYHRKHPGKTIWWEGEGIVIRKDIEKFQDIDVVVSHDSPLCCPPFISPEFDLEGRGYLEKVMKKLKPKEWYFGHHHISIRDTFEDCKVYGLCIHEIVESI